MTDYNVNLFYFNCHKMALKQNSVHFFLFLNRVRISNPQWIAYTKILVE